MKKRSVMLVGPVLLFIPVVMVLYVTVEVSLNSLAWRVERDSLQDERGLTSLDQVQSVSSQDQHQQRLQDAMKNMYQVLEEENQVRKDNEGREGNVEALLFRKEEPAETSNITFPPFVDDVDNQLGEGGKPATMNVSTLTSEEKRQYDQGWERNSFNQYISDRISIRRSLQHGWSQECSEMPFRKDLPEVSVIFIFHNEAWSIVLRSVHSVLSRTPAHLLKEVILVDDCSTFGHLKEPLDEYWRRTDGRVKVIHSPDRVGLTRARLLGYDVATAPMLVFFDSHIECFPGWFEPLADRIASDPNVTVFPSIEVINPDTFEILLNHNVGSLGIFRWRDLTFQWGVIPEEEKTRRLTSAYPIRSPTMPGGLFAISREFFTRLGTYDPGLQYWGGENMELSFKAWMCYGSVELVPCSHVGHVFRRSNPIKWDHNVGLTNVARVAHVWMDDYKNYFLERNLYHVGDYGDVTDRHKLRERMQCHDFAWFVRHVLPVARPPVSVLHAGELKQADGSQCVDSYEPNSIEPKVIGCHGQGGNQFWYISSNGEMFQDKKRICERNGKMILDADCQDKWNVTQAEQLVHVASGRCLQGDAGQLSVQLCDQDRPQQKWQTKPRPQELTFPLFD